MLLKGCPSWQGVLATRKVVGKEGLGKEVVVT